MLVIFAFLLYHQLKYLKRPSKKKGEYDITFLVHLLLIRLLAISNFWKVIHSEILSPWCYF